MVEEREQLILSEQEAKAIKELFEKYLKLYKEKDESVSDKEWLEYLLKNEISGLDLAEAGKDAEEIIASIDRFNENYKSVNEAAEKGISKESWLENKIKEASTAVSVNEYGRQLQFIDDMLYTKNMELSDALQRSADGQIKMSYNLDGNIAENMIANTTEMDAFLKGKNIAVEVRDVFTPNSVDVRAINLDTGRYQNYQLKFGKDARATIDLIERGNYNNQRIVVPSEQVEEIQAYFKNKGSNKTITDHIEVWGAKGKSFTKQEMKNLQLKAQEDGVLPTVDYTDFQTATMVKSVAKNAGVLGLQSAAIATGLTVASKVFKGEKIEGDEIIQIALKTGTDTSVKVVSSAALNVAVRNGWIKLIPKGTPAGTIANIASVGIENAKILMKIASGELSLTKGLDQMGRVTVSMTAGLIAAGEGTFYGMCAGLMIAGPIGAVVGGFIGGMVGYFCGSKIGEAVYSAGKKVASVAKNVARTAVNGLKKVGRSIVEGGKKVLDFLFG